MSWKFLLSFWGAVPAEIPKIPNFWAIFLPFNREPLENGYMSIRAQHQLDWSFLKMYSMGRSPTAAPPKIKYVAFFRIFFSVINFYAICF